MLGGLRRLMGVVSVKQTPREIVVSGIPTDVMQRDIAKIWKTSRINEHMFTRASKAEMAFHPFFAPDIVYMLDTMTTHRSRNTSVKVLSTIRDLLIANTWLSNTVKPVETPRLNLKHLDKFIFSPRDFQQTYFDIYNRIPDQYNLNGYLLAAAPGSGKTFMGLALGECLEAERIFVICPKNAIDRVWVKSIEDIYKKDRPSYWAASSGKPYNGERILIAHYEALPGILNILDKVDTSGTVEIILDESHNLNEVSAQRTNHFIELCKRTGSKNIIWASGTPIKALGAEAIPLLRTIDPYFDEAAEFRYRKIFGKDGNKGIDILRHRMGLISYKVEKKQLELAPPIMKALPVKIPTGNLYTLTAIAKDMEAFITERWKYYNSRKAQDQAFWNKCVDYHKNTLKSSADREAFNNYMRNVKIVIQSPDPRYVGEEIKACNAYEKARFTPSLPKEWQKDFLEVKTIIKYTNLKIQGEALGRVLGRKRIECHVAMVPYVDYLGVCESTTKKTLIFTSFVPALEEMNKHCGSIGLKPLVVYGKTNNELAQTVAKFEKDEELNPLIATYNSLSTAVPLVMADTMIMLNSPFRAYIFDQAISRIHRIGATTQTVVYQASLDTGEEPNISTRSSDILKWSQEQVEAIMGIKSPFEVEVDSFESFGNVESLDEHRLMHQVLQHTFNQFDITISEENFDLNHVVKTIQVPSFINW